ncbi:MAG: flagellar hook basal-body protein [Candidatus Saganbacteria bacterium]|nr:flagellar hook basal-body protein [Candidatus Saganbacteria bacterium]
MFDIMSQAKNAITAYNSALSVHSANIANMSVNGYKALNISFESILSQVMNGGTAANTFANQGGTNPMQVGSGTGIADVSIDFTQGSFVSGSTIDLAIDGIGLFVVSADGGSSYRYTRSGDFSVDSNGNLTTAAGHQVYGLDAAGNLVAITGLAGSSTNYSWSAAGELLYNTNATGYRIALSYFANPGGLAQSDGTTFVETLSSGAAKAPAAAGGTAGTLKTTQLEQSNVFYLGETIDSLEIQRALSGNLSVVKMASDIIQNFISKLG